MSVVVTEQASTELVSTEQAKEWCRVLNSDHDTLIPFLVKSAREYVENYTGRALLERTYEDRRARFPASRVINLENPPLRDVESVQYVLDGQTLTLSEDCYTVDEFSTPGRIVLKDSQTWPSTDCVPNAVIITYTAGYDNNEESEERLKIPQTLLLGIKFLVGHWFANREPESPFALTPVPKTFDSSIFPWKVNW
jgi:uncharacterized phiE125 gp8 family phage protein